MVFKEFQEALKLTEAFWRQGPAVGALEAAVRAGLSELGVGVLAKLYRRCVLESALLIVLAQTISINSVQLFIVEWFRSLQGASESFKIFQKVSRRGSARGRACPPRGLREL